jgi:hypothetical protein
MDESRDLRSRQPACLLLMAKRVKMEPKCTSIRDFFKANVSGSPPSTPVAEKRSVAPPSTSVPQKKQRAAARATVAEPAAKPAAKPAAAKALPVTAEAAPPAVHALQVAAADAEAAQICPIERRRLWMEYLRTRQVAKSGGREKKSDGLRSEKCPESLMGRVERDPNAWFKIWLRCGKSWGQVQVEEIKTQQTSVDEQLEEEWIWGFDLDKRMPKCAATVLKKSLRDTEAWRIYPGCEHITDAKERESVEQFHLETVNKSVASSSAQSSSSRRFKGDAGALPEDALREMATSSSAQEAIEDIPKTPEQIAEEARVKQQRKADMRQKAQEPKNVVKTWLNSLPKDIKDAKQALNELTKTTVVPSSACDEYKKKFTDHIQALEALRSDLEDSQAHGTEASVDLKGARAAVISLKADAKLWADVQALYAP